MVPAVAQVSVAIRSPNVSIGINLPLYPELVPVPGYPVYYAPDVDSNYFFYDGLYWVYQDDGWYASYWYNGPWELVEPEFVPLFVLRVPVQYYRRPPWYFRSWQPNEPPRWGVHWGNEWSRHHSGWDHWDRHSAPAPAPLPVYQRQYSGDRYPKADRQSALQNQNYRYQPHDSVARQVYQTQRANSAPAAARTEPQRAQQPRTKAPNVAAGSDGQPNTTTAPHSPPSQTQRENPQRSVIQAPARAIEATRRAQEQKPVGQETRPRDQAAPPERAQKPNKKDDRASADEHEGDHRK